MAQIDSPIISAVLYCATGKGEKDKTEIVSGRLSLRALAAHFIKKYRCGGPNVQRIHVWRHGNCHGVIARGQHRRGNTIAFAAKDDTAISAEIGLRQDSFIGVWMGGDAVDAASVKLFEALNECQIRGMRLVSELMSLAEFCQLDDWQLQQRAHGIADSAPKKRAAGGFTDNQRLHTERNAVPNERAEILGVRQRVNGDKEPGARALPEKFFQ
jgi:hypothetical protein